MLMLILALSRIVASEAGFTPSDDAAAIIAVIYDRAERMGIEPIDAARAYAPQSFNRMRHDRRRWVAHLALSGARPDGWPAHMSWERHRDEWLGLVSRVTEILKHPGESNCSEVPNHWSAPSFMRPYRLGWIRVDCGNVRNASWALPVDRD